MPFHIHGGFPPLFTLALVVVALVYLRGWYQLRSAFPNVLSMWRLVAFISGIFSGWIALGSPLAVMDHHLLTGHMAQHLLLMTVAAPLILLGAPAITLLHGLPQHFLRNILRPFGRWPLVHGFGNWFGNWFGNTVTHPVFCWLAATAAVIGWHVPAAFQLALGSHWWHTVENATFLLAGLLFWWPVVQSRPSLGQAWSMPLYLFLATLPCDILSAFLAFCGRVVYPSYLAAPRLFDLSPLQDQEFAGALMWVSVTLIYLIPAVIITVQILSPGVQAESEAVKI